MDQHYLTPLFTPQSLAVFAGPVDQPEAMTPSGRLLCQALRAQRFQGDIQFLSTEVSGTLADLAQARADLAIIALPEAEAASTLELAARMHCRAALVLTTGLCAERAAELKRIAQREGIHLMGPNSLGLQRPALQLNASTAGPLAAEGSLGLVSQSGALTSAILDWAQTNGVGFSTVASVGPHTPVDVAQVLDFLAHDRKTQSIVMYLEGIGDARAFMSALRSAASAKPVIVLKAGRKLSGNAAAQTHSGATVGSDDVFDAALRRAGAVRVRSFVELFSAAKCLASRYRPVGRRLAIIANGGGPGVLAADWIHELGLELGPLSADSITALQPQLAPCAQLEGLIDLGAESTAEHYRLALEAANRDRQIDGVLVVHSARPQTDPAAVAQAVTEVRKQMTKPLLTCWIGDASMGEGRQRLKQASIPTFRTPEAAVGAFGNIASYYQNQQLLQQTPPPQSTQARPDIEGARLIIESALAERRHTLTEMESKAILAAFHIPVTRTLLARSAHEAMMIATQLGFPVALKIDSPDLSHKSDVGGVELNLASGLAVRDAYAAMIERVRRLRPEARINGVTVQVMARARRGREIYVGLVTDEPFGPVIAFGAGGTMVELLDDHAMELPPLNQFLARRMIERSRVATTLAPWRGAPAADIGGIEQILLRVSEMACELPQLREMDINPIIVDADGAVAVDARMVVAPVSTAGSGSSNPYHHLAILPYPSRYQQVWPLPGGGEYLIRPIHPSDAQMLQALTQGLSTQSRYYRFVSSMTELPPSMLARFTLIDYDREMALVAILKERTATPDGEIRETERMVGVSRYVINPDLVSCEFALVVADDFNGKGLGSRLMHSIMEVARDKGLQTIEGLVLTNNHPMLKLMKRLGFQIKNYAEDPDFKLVSHQL